MKVNINSVHFKIDQKLESFITTKLEKLAVKNPEIIGADVTLKLENTDLPDNKISEIRVLLKGNDLFATKQSKTFEESVDEAIDALKKQMEKHKKRTVK
ncbi:MAG: ribosome-associated translation inhibitor RaiA [Lentimicrobiaceae bacterium]|jgi:putative sigma-54 modulation protein|nr:ribosome-associated translation inhibitor RaiA [Lentimicrobiaceae bacterium]